MGRMSLSITALIAAIVGFLFSRSRKEQKKTTEWHKVDCFSYEMMFKWFRENTDVTQKDIVCAVVRKEALKKAAIASGSFEKPEDEDIALVIINEKTGDVLNFNLIRSNSIEKDIMDLLKDKDMVIIE